MRVLVTGGAGYIGSQTVRQLVERHVQVVVADSLENGHRSAVAPDVPLLVGNIGDREFLRQVFRRGPFDAVIHFAGYISPKESTEKPGKYIRNNVAYTNELVGEMIEHDVKRIVFSSSAAVYGNPQIVPMPEDQPLEPISAYGASKLMVERLFPWFEESYELHAINLRYFNAAGAMLDGSYGEDHPNEIHIIPLALRAALAGKAFSIFGEDYPTPDGTCIRDYIHIIDLAEAHLLALDALMNGHTTRSYNVGTGKGYSNRQIAEVVRKITGIPLDVRMAARRPGDPAELVADSSRLQKEFGWKPKYSDLETIVGSAHKWHTTHPNGYADK